MAVIMAPRNNNSYSLNIGGLLTNLLGEQISAMINRGTKAREVEAQRAVMQALGDTSQMTGEEILRTAMSHPSYGKAGDGIVDQLAKLAAARERNYGLNEFTQGMVGSGFAPAAVQALTGSARSHETPMQQSILDRVLPKYELENVDTGDEKRIYTRNPYSPEVGLVEQFKKGISPDTQYQGETSLQQTKMTTDAQRDIARMNIAAQASRERGMKPVMVRDKDGNYMYVTPQEGVPIQGDPVGLREGLSGKDKWEMAKGIMAVPDMERTPAMNGMLKVIIDALGPELGLNPSNGQAPTVPLIPDTEFPRDEAINQPELVVAYARQNKTSRAEAQKRVNALIKAQDEARRQAGLPPIPPIPFK